MITWLSSFPKSGNTWVRLLLNAYLCGGYVNINSFPWGRDDNHKQSYVIVSPKEFSELTEHEIILLRPAALMTMMGQNPMLIKSHHYYGSVNGVHLFPKTLTKHAFYMARDPREIAPSLAAHMDCDIDEAIRRMTDPDFSVMNSKQDFHLVGNWSDHVKSWLHKDFPVYATRYSDLKKDPEGTLTSMVKLLGLKLDKKKIQRSVENTQIEKLQSQEKRHGFRENKGKNLFFGGKRQKLTESQKLQIENDHSEMMELVL